jgi:SAM-dependent methyltransferase
MNIDLKKLKEIAKQKSKHSDYQILHPSISKIINDAGYSPKGRREKERFDYFIEKFSVNDLRILDIGANTGYFSFASIEDGAKFITVYEGNKSHSEFIELASKVINVSEKINVIDDYYSFEDVGEKFDVVFCLNVLHHIGDDFGNTNLSINDAREKIIFNLNKLSKIGKKVFFQLGFNWKGDVNSPLFKNGEKSELIEFIKTGTRDNFYLDNIAIFNPKKNSYEELNNDLLRRFDDLGEFLNRPIFILTAI